MPIGTVYIAVCTLLALWPLRRPWLLGKLSWILTLAFVEVPFVFLYLIVVSHAGDLVDGVPRDPRSWIVSSVVVLTAVGLLAVAWRARRARPVLDDALRDGLGGDWRDRIAPELGVRLRTRRPWVRILLAPWRFGRRDVEHLRDVAYGPDRPSNLLDVYRPRDASTASERRPTFVYLHGGGFRGGRKNREARPLLYHLASRGWTCISADYHLGAPSDAFPLAAVDVKRLIAWLRTDGGTYGVDPDTIVLSGGSAGAHLAVTAALSIGDPALQPGFEDADTSVAAVVGCYGYYGDVGGTTGMPTTPLGFHGSPPPCFVIHGDQDTYTPPAGAREMVAHLRSVSSDVVVYAELHGAQHSFDLFHSVRYEAVIDAIEGFTAWVRSRSVHAGDGREPADRSATNASRWSSSSKPTTDQ